jgi:hypothetical protein
MHRVVYAASGTAFLAFAPACSSSDGAVSVAAMDASAAAGDTGSDAGTSPAPPTDAGPAAGPPTALPRVPNHGGAVIAHVKLVTITFAGFPFRAGVEAFGDWIVGSKWLSEAGAEYGIGAGTHLAKLVVDYTPPPVVAIADIERYIGAGITMGVFPQPDPDTLYVIYYPTTTKPAGLGCDGAWWGHTTATSPVRFTYAAIPACPPPAIFGWTQLQTIEEDASHEIIEALTDPDPHSAPGYAITDPLDPFHYLGTEIGDLCVGLTIEESGFTAQRAWSNVAAAAGRSPCVPAPPGDVFFSAMPATGQPLTIAAGGNANVTVTGWATGARGPWTIAAVPFPGFDATLYPSGVLDRRSLDVGETATLTLTVPASAQSGTRGIVIVDSLTVDATGKSTGGPYEWPILVEVP